ncbi:MAG: VPLPA-CTERM sorting domain-containing protein [Pseudomonadales bacterium]
MKSHKLYLPGALTVALMASSITEAEFINGNDWVLNLEYRQFTPDNPPFSRHVYICDTEIAGNCEDSATWNSLTAESGWTLGNGARVRLFDSGTNTSPTPPDGVPSVIDFNGYQLNYGAYTDSATIIGPAPGGAFVIGQVERDTVLTYNAGTVVHEVTDTAGNKYVMQLAAVYVAEAVDLTMEGAMVAMALPEGWSYSSRTLTEQLNAATGGTATVFGTPDTTWQLYSAVPVPAAAYLFGSALIGLAAIKRKRR